MSEPEPESKPDPQRQAHIEEARATLAALEADLEEAMETAEAIAKMLKPADAKAEGDEDAKGAEDD